MTQTKEQSIDILAGFTLHSALSFTEMVIYNYAKIYETKEEILGHTRRFFTVNPIRIGYKNLTQNFKLLEEYEEKGIIMVRIVKTFEKEISPQKVYARKGRPFKYMPE